MIKLLVIKSNFFSLHPAELLRLREFADVHIISREALTPETVSGCEIIFGNPPPDILIHAIALKWLHLATAGADRYMNLSLFARNDIILTTSSGAYGKVIAEHVLALMFALSRQLPHYVRAAQKQEWIMREDVLEVSDSAVAIFGLGDLGSSVAKLLKPLDCRILGVRKNIFEKPPYVDELFSMTEKLTVLSKADYIISCLPKTCETDNIFDCDAFDKMRPNSVFINVGRGNCTDEGALYRALKDGRIFGAGLDVTSVEPLPKDSRLWDLDNIIITSHTASVSQKDNNLLSEIFFDQMIRYTSGRRLKNTVNFIIGY